jgi:dTDP-4-amino-4,6-dideoxygalactose transaminase
MSTRVTSVPFLDLARQHAGLQPELSDAIGAVIDASAFILGPDVAAFEREWAEFCEADFAVGVNSGTAAIELSLECLGIGPGDEVIAPANTFVATVFPVMRSGATPVLVDCDPATALVDLDAVEAAMTPRTKAILPVHLYGQPADLGPLLELADRHGVHVVEDACQSHGARYGDRRVGTFGATGCFSFYPGKNLGALGDGGAIVTNDGDLAERLRHARDLGQRQKYDHVAAGRNERLDTIQAAALRVKLAHLDDWNEQRRRAADYYRELLADTELILPEIASGREPVWHLYVVRHDDRDGLRAALDEAGVQTGLHYPRPVHLQDACAGLGYGPGSFPAAEDWSTRGLSLPMFPELERDEQEAVAAAIRRALDR